MPGALHRTRGADQRDRIVSVAAAETEATGRRPFGEGLRAMLATADPAATWFWQDGRAYVGAIHDEIPTLELAADPDHPEAAAGLLRLLRRELLAARLWAHGDHSQARRAARAEGLPVLRRLLVMSRSLAGIPAAPPPPGVLLRPFEPDRDAGRWLELNRTAFRALPDQGGWTESDLRQRLRSPGHEPAGFIVAEQGSRLVGFHWTKIDAAATVAGAGSGEVYVIAVEPEQQGSGLAAALLAAGLQHLAGAGLTRAHLFVDEQNPAAIRLYRRAGFDRIDTDRQYGW